MSESTVEEGQAKRRAVVPWLLAAIMLGAALLRLWGLTWGLPDSAHLFSYHPDEYHSLRGLFSLLTGDFNPHFFNYGSLYLYLVAFPAFVFHADLMSYLLGSGAPDVAMRAWTLDARIVTLIASLGTVWVVYAIGARLAGRKCGLWAAGLLAVMPLHVLQSHYATVDVTEAFFVACCLLFALRIYQQGTVADYIVAGLMAGLAASTKYNGAVVMVAPVVAWAAALQASRFRSTWWRLGLCALAMGAAFAATSPYTFLAWSEARRDIGFELQHMRVGEPTAVAADPSGVVFHLKHLLAPGAGLILPLGLAGIYFGLRHRRRESWPLALFGMVWFVMISAAGVRYARYEVPLAPVLAVLAGYAAAGWRGRSVWRSPGLAAGVFALGLALWWSYGIDYNLASRDPRARALSALASAPQVTSIGLVEQPWFGAPPVDYCNGGTVLRSMPIWSRFQRALRPLVITGMDAEALRRARPQSFVLSEFDYRNALQRGDAQAVAFISALRRQYGAPRAVFGGQPPGLAPWPLASDYEYAWPRIEVYGVSEHR